MAFPATPFGHEPEKSYPKVVLDAMAATKTPPKSVAILTSKFPSAQFMAEGTREVAKQRGLNVALYLEYEFGTRDFNAIAARVKDTNADLLWVGALGLDSNLLLEALKKLDYVPKRHFHLYPAPGPLALAADGDLALCSTFLEPAPPFTDRPDVPKIAALYKERAAKANVPYTEFDAQGAGMISQWQILEQGIIGAKSLDDKAIAQFLKKSGATTIYGKLRFDGPFNHGDPAQMVKQVQNKKWVVVWPKEFAPPGVSLIAP
jgi:branched-chain amino acid transport system substrate-binding protein